MDDFSSGKPAATVTHAAATLPPDLVRLVEEAVAATLPGDIAARAVTGDPETLSSLGRSIAAQEGYLIEHMVIALAATHPDRIALTGLRLPIQSAALDLIKSNKRVLYQGLSLDATATAVATYRPDLVIVDRVHRSALILDVKRSLMGYAGGSKLSELCQRMTAAAFVLPDVLWRDHQRTAVETVKTAIVDASKTALDVSDGVWSLGRLDDLLDVPDAAEFAKRCIEMFRSGIRQVWRDAIASHYGMTTDIISRSEPMISPIRNRTQQPQHPVLVQPSLRPSSITVGRYS